MNERAVVTLGVYVIAMVAVAPHALFPFIGWVVQATQAPLLGTALLFGYLILTVLGLGLIGRNFNVAAKQVVPVKWGR